MISKFNPWIIIVAQFKTFHDSASDKLSISESLFFVSIPIASTTGLLLWTGEISGQATETISTIVAVFAGLLLNFLVLVANLSKQGSFLDGSLGERRGELVSETYANVSFAILVSLVSLIASIASTLIDVTWSPIPIASMVVYFTVTMLIVTLLQVLKRMYVLLETN